MLPLIPIFSTAAETRIPAEMPVQTRNRTADIFPAFVKESPARARNGAARSRSRYQTYSFTSMLTD